jgi:uncharacterized protein YdaU (DUF1376 family)
MLEHGAYTLLLDACYDRERFPTIEEALEWSWARSEDEIAAVKFVLSKFFTLTDSVYAQQRVKDEIDAYRAKSIKNQEIAIAREAARRSTRERSEHETCTNDHLTINHKPLTTNQEPLTSNQEKAHVPDAQSRADYFDRFWKLYPKKKSKADAEKAWSKLKMTDEFFSSIIASLSAQAASKDWKKDGGQYIPLAGGWIRGKRWEDETQSPASNHNGFEQIDYMDGLTVDENGSLRF